MAVTVNTTTERPTHHIKLTKGADEIGLIVCDANGDASGKIERNPQPRRTVQLDSQEQKYSNPASPFKTIALDDFEGRGQETWEDDKTRYLDGWRMNTLRKGRVLLGGQETYSTGGYRDVDQSIPGSVTFKEIYYSTATTWRTTKFTSSAAYNMMGIEIILKRVGSPQDVTVSLYSDNAGSLNAELKSKIVSASDVTSDVLSVQYLFEFDSVYACANATDYHVVVKADASDDADNHWEVACDTDNPTGGQIYRGAFVADYALYYRVLDDTADFNALLFEYKGAQYKVTQPDAGGNSYLYINGYRGAADANTGALDKLKDSLQTGWSSADVGAIVVITRGPGSNEAQPWREVTAGASGELDVSPSWNIEHSTDTEYVVVKHNVWTSLQDLGAYVTDVAVAGEYVYFARGDEPDDLGVLRYQAYNVSGTWTVRTEAEILIARYLAAIFNPSLGAHMVWGTVSNYNYSKSFVWYGTVPEAWDGLYTDLGILAPTGVAWSNYDYGNVGSSSGWGTTYISILDAFTTGLCARLEFDAVDITGADIIYFRIKSDIACAADDLVLLWSTGGADTAEVGIPALEAGVWTWVALDIDPTETPAPDETAVTMIALRVDTDNGAQDIWLDGGIRVARITLVDTISLGGERITGLGVASGDPSYPRQNPWVFTEGTVYEIQTQNGNIAVPLPLSELSELASASTGRANIQNDAYFYFNLRDKIERYYNNKLDDVGPDTGAGLPANRQGEPYQMVSYPGAVIYSIDGRDDNYSSIPAMQSDRHHELYRAPRTGVRIRGMNIQAIPGSKVARLWFSMGADILWIPIAINPEKADDFRYVCEASMEIGRIHDNVQDVEKFFKSIKTITENLSAGHREIFIDYKLDGTSSWTAIASTFDTSPFEENDFSSAYDKSGKWIELRVRMTTDDNTETPILMALVLKSIRRDVPVKTYSMYIRLADKDTDLNQDPDPTPSMAAKLTLLDSWAWDTSTPVLVASVNPILDGAYVFPEPIAPSLLKKATGSKGNPERWIAPLELVEI